MQKEFSFQYHPGLENLADFYTKAFTSKDTQRMRPFYVHEKNSQQFLTRALLPSAWRGCVGISRDSPNNGKTQKLLHTYESQIPSTRNNNDHDSTSKYNDLNKQIWREIRKYPRYVSKGH